MIVCVCERECVETVYPDSREPSLNPRFGGGSLSLSHTHFLSHTHAHTHTHSLSFSRTHAHFLSIPSPTPSFPLSLSLADKECGVAGIARSSGEFDITKPIDTFDARSEPGPREIKRFALQRFRSRMKAGLIENGQINPMTITARML